MRSRDPDPGSEKPAKRLQPHRRPAQAGEVRPHSDRRADPPTARLAGLSLQRGNHVMRLETGQRSARSCYRISPCGRRDISKKSFDPQGA